MKLTMLTNCGDIWYNNAPNCTISCLNFQNFSKTPPPAFSQASPSMLGRFAPSARTSPSMSPHQRMHIRYHTDIIYRHFFFSTSSPGSNDYSNSSFYHSLCWILLEYKFSIVCSRNFIYRFYSKFYNLIIDPSVL